MDDKLAGVLEIWDFLMTFRNDYCLQIDFTPQELLVAFVKKHIIIIFIYLFFSGFGRIGKERIIRNDNQSINVQIC